MRHLPLVVLLFALTAPNDATLWIAGDGIEVVRVTPECPDGTEVRASTGTYCVQETVEDIIAKIKTDAEEAADETEDK